MLLFADLSGIQPYVLGVKPAGSAQAKRLRARSFLVELYEHAALESVKNRLGVDDSAVLTRGGGGFLVKVEDDVDQGLLQELNDELQRRLWHETGGEIHLSFGWGEEMAAARASLEQRKRRPGVATLQLAGVWLPDEWSRPALGDPCEVCGKASIQEYVEADDDRTGHCGSCLTARRLGENLTRWEWMRTTDDPASIRVLGVGFSVANTVTRANEQGSRIRVGHWIPRQSRGSEPLTFEEIAAQARGVPLLAVLKADVDDMGLRLAEAASVGETQLKELSYALHEFFRVELQDMIKREWPSMYTIYAGGDDLLLVGPWNLVLDFAGAVVERFQAGPVQQYTALTLSAGLALSLYRAPVRHAVETAETLLESAKDSPGKDRCAALGASWRWDSHRVVVGDGKRLASWIENPRSPIPRTFLHRLLHLAAGTTLEEKLLAPSRWAYQIHRNLPGGNREAPQVTQLRRWANGTLTHLVGRIEQCPHFTQGNGSTEDPGCETCNSRSEHQQAVSESTATLRYALMATRRTRE